jgi:hypothetical protein
MRWLRSNIGRIAWLAFFALACQLVLTFGHVHAGKGFSGAGLAAVAAAGKSTDQGPVNPPTPLGATDEFCAICANISLASALAVPLAPAVVVPISFISRLPDPDAETRPASITYLLFNARGPPSAWPFGLSRRIHPISCEYARLRLPRVDSRIARISAKQANQR